MSERFPDETIIYDINATEVSESDLVSILEVARWGFAMVHDEIADCIDISDEEMIRLREITHEILGIKSQNRCYGKMLRERFYIWEFDGGCCERCGKTMYVDPDHRIFCECQGFRAIKYVPKTEDERISLEEELQMRKTYGEDD